MEQTVMQEIAQELINKLNQETVTHRENALKSEGAILGVQLLFQELVKNEKEATNAETREAGEAAENS